MNEKHEDRIQDLIEELNDHPEEEFISGKMMRAWAEKCIEYETEERDAVVTLLKHAQCPKVIIDLIDRGVHRKRSTQVMKALKVAVPDIEAARLEQLCKKYVDG